ncbi:Gfo/Idh/MocA family protein [Tsukamurella soli]|uniref:Gfo/Idh/MocA family oxidoreductase n=1 Tax=Tsukamurella soli TaxID=644556 RepID=A0ABP8JIJ4_9ACTN
MTAPLSVGVVGCGNVALNFHVPAYLALPGDYTLVGLADPSPDRLAAGARIAGLDDSHLHTDAAELIARADVDVIDVCTPQHLHRDLVVAAARAGKHIMCEKPLAATPSDAAAMVAAAAAAGVRLAVMHNYLFFPEVVALRGLIDDGELGTVRTVTVDMLGVVDSPGAGGSVWRHDPAQSGGGVLVDMLHGVYLAEHLLGEQATAVSAFVDSVIDGDRVEGIALCRLEAGRRVALVNIAWGVGQGGIAVEGTGGRAVVRYRGDGTPPWAPFESLTVTTPSGGTRTVDLAGGQELAQLIADAVRDTVADLAAAVRTGRAPAADGAVGLHTLEETVAAYASAALRATVDLPLTGALHDRGVGALAYLDVAPQSLVAQRALFGPANSAAANSAV